EPESVRRIQPGPVGRGHGRAPACGSSAPRIRPQNLWLAVLPRVPPSLDVFWAKVHTQQNRTPAVSCSFRPRAAISLGGRSVAAARVLFQIADQIFIPEPD